MSTKPFPHPSIPPARQAALTVLDRTLHHGAELQAALNQTLTSHTLSSADSGLTTELAYGTIRFKGRIDHLLHTFLHRGKKLPPKLLHILETAAYEILFLDRVPAYASVSWAVDAAKTLVSDRFAGLANAVLRKVTSLGLDAHDESFYRCRGAGRVKTWSRFYSCPPWLVRLWLESYGEEECKRLLLASLAAPPIGVRCNWTRPEARDLYHDLSVKTGVMAGARGVALPRGLPDDFADWEAAGLVSRQSLAAQESLIELGGLGWEHPIWDACAGRGGKSCFLAEQGRGMILASDVHMGRLKGLAAECSRLDLGNLYVFRARADSSMPFKTIAPTILLDAPCSGLGVLSRRPDIKWKRTLKDVTALAALQARMIDNCWQELPPGGRLVYLTCTLNPQENEQQRIRFQQRHTGWKPETIWQTPSDSPHAEFFFGFTCTKS